MSTASKARRDAAEFARAQMYYGEGAGTRRKLITAAVESKSARDPAYGRAFNAELARQDMAEHAAKARKERARTDRLESTRKNTKAVMTGNFQGATTAVVVFSVVATYAHQTGLDKKAYEKGKQLYYDAKLRYKKYRANLKSVS